VARPCKAVVKYVDFSRRIQQLCSAAVSNWRRNTAHYVVPSNFGGFAMPAPVPVPLPRSSLALDFFQLCLKLASGGLNLGFHPFLIDPYSSLHCLCLYLQHEAKLFVKVVPHVC
jgi:hypothetical protein